MYTVQPLQCIFNSPFHVCAAAVYKSDDRYSSTAIRTHRAHSIRQSEKWTMSHANNAVTWGRCQLQSPITRASPISPRPGAGYSKVVPALAHYLLHYDGV